MRYRVRGTHVGNGRRVVARISAGSVAEAVRRAERLGVRILEVQPDPGTGDGPSAATAEAVQRWPAILAGVALAVAGLGGVLLLASVRKPEVIPAPVAMPSVVVADTSVAAMNPNAEVASLPSVASVAVPPSEAATPQTTPVLPPFEGGMERVDSSGEKDVRGEKKDLGVVEAAATIDPAEAAYDGQPRTGWLSTSEVAALSAFGLSAVVDGRAVNRPANWASLAELASAAPAPLAKRLRVIAEAAGNMHPTEEEKQEFDRLMKNGVQATQNQLAFGFLDALAGRDPFDNAIDTMNGVMKSARISDAWKLQRIWTERFVEARIRLDGSLQWLLDNLRARSTAVAGTRPVEWRLVTDKNELLLEGVASVELSEPSVVRIEMRKKPINGQWTGLNAASGLFARGLGVTAMDAAAQAEGTMLAAAQERASNLPWVVTFLLPPVRRDGRVRIVMDDGLAVRDALALEGVDVHLMGADCLEDVEGIEGLDKAQELARAQLQAQRDANRGRGWLGVSRGSGTTNLTRDEAQEKVRSLLADARKVVRTDRERALRHLADARRIGAKYADLVAETEAVRKPIIASLENERADAEAHIATATKEVARWKAECFKRPKDPSPRRSLNDAQQRLSKLQREASRIRSLLAIQ